MPGKVLFIAFVWNQHQPYYLDAGLGKFIMPWVRLHGNKDYYQMAAILEDYPDIRLTFSLSPSLLEQLQAYFEQGVEDYYLMVMKKAAELNEAEKKFLLLHYFDIHREKVVSRYPFYRQLLERRGATLGPDPAPGSGPGPASAPLGEALRKFATQDFLDLQVWFNLVWIDPEIREKDSFLKGLQEKGRNFTEAEKEMLLKKHFEVMHQIIPQHRRLQKSGRIEIATTAYYHPILPLLVDNHSALRSSPGLPLPRRFCYQEDARAQVEMAVEQYAFLFGEQPRGFWPPEQAVSPELVPLLVDSGYKWTISDEQILAHSMNAEVYRDGYGHVLNPEMLYMPYTACGEGAEIPIVFRDHHLSDRIGFVYQHMSGRVAAEDLVHRFHKIREKLGRSPGEHLVTVALDCENAWEWYDGDKGPFLHHLYRLLAAEPHLETVTVSEFLEENPPVRRIAHLSTGSWVDHSLTRWIGTEHKNMLWDYLLQARDTVKKCAAAHFEGRKVKEALQHIYKAQGSDYAWWIDSMPYYLAAPFEALFRKHLCNAYCSLDIEPPAYLHEAVIKPPPGEQSWDEDPLLGPVCMVPGSKSDR